MIPILYEYNVVNFAGHGLGDLVDCLECKSVMSDTGEWEIELRYPCTGAHFSDLEYGRLIVVKANHYQTNYQAFRIYKVEKSIDGTALIFAEHISYDLAWIPVKPFKATTCRAACSGLKSNSLVSHDFTIAADSSISTMTGEFEITEPTSFRKALLDGDSSVKGVFGGDLIFDNYNITISQIGGEDRLVSIDYGVDLIDVKQEINNSQTITGVLPYYRRSGNNTGCIIGDVQEVGIGYRRQQIVSLDLTEFFPNSEPTKDQLNNKARSWMRAEDIGEPEISMTVNYAWLGQDVRLYDAVRVRMLKMGIDVKSKVSKYTYDCLKEQPVEIEVGKAKESLYFSLEDASRLRKGLLPPERIKNESITSGKLGGGAVTTPKIAPNAVKEDELDDLSVSGAKIQLAQIVSDHFSGEVIDILDGIDQNASKIARIINGSESIDISKATWGGATLQLNGRNIEVPV